MSKWREEIIGDCRLILGDSLDILPTISSVDHIIADPPYEAIMHASINGFKDLRTDGVNSTARSLGFDCIDAIRQDICNLYKQVCNGWVINFCTSEGVALWRDAIESSGIKYKRACVWVKPDAAPQFNGQGPALGHEMIVTAWAGKGHSRWNGRGKRGVFSHLVNPTDREGTHPTEKPVRLMKELVCLFTNPGELILDPFLGSGTTGIATLQTGRKFIGIEKDASFFELACRRIEKCHKQPDMLIEQIKKSEQMALEIL